MTGSEGPGAGQEVVFPHPFENPVISVGEPGPCFLKSVVPGKKGFFVVRSEIMDVLDYEKPLNGLGNLGDAGQHPIGEDITVDPRVTVDSGNIISDGVEQKNPSLFQTAMDDVHKCTVVFPPDMFEHPDGNDLVEASFDLPVILTEDFHR